MRKHVRSYLHEPVIIVVQVARIGLVDFDNRNKVLVGDENFVVAVKDASQVNASSKGPLENRFVLAKRNKVSCLIYLELRGGGEKLFDGRLLLRLSTVRR